MATKINTTTGSITWINGRILDETDLADTLQAKGFIIESLPVQTSEIQYIGTKVNTIAPEDGTTIGSFIFTPRTSNNMILGMRTQGIFVGSGVILKDVGLGIVEKTAKVGFFSKTDTLDQTNGYDSCFLAAVASGAAPSADPWNTYSNVSPIFRINNNNVTSYAAGYDEEGASALMGQASYTFLYKIYGPGTGAGSYWISGWGAEIYYIDFGHNIGSSSRFTHV